MKYLNVLETGYNMKVKRLIHTAHLPTKAHAGDLGYDLYSADNIHIPGRQTVLVPTGISIEFPVGYGGLIRDRSSVATKKHLFTVAGVIDNGYTGEIKVAIFNSSKLTQSISVGEKFAQLILIPTVNFPVIEVAQTFSADGRGDNGFGSTGATHVTQNKTNSWI